MLCNANPRNKKEKHKNQRTKVTKGKTIKHKDPREPRQIRDTESHQLLDKES